MKNRLFKILSFLGVIILITFFAYLKGLAIKIKNDAKLPEEENMYREIERKCYELPDTRFLDALSNYDLTKLSEFHQALVKAMRDYNLAIEPLHYGHYKEVINRFNQMKKDYFVDNLKNLVSIDVDFDIKKYEYMFIKNTELLKEISRANNSKYRVCFGRTKNNKPLYFAPVAYENGKYLLLQSSYLPINFKYSDLYDDEGNNLMNDNDKIRDFFKVEDELIKDIFIFSDEDYDKYFGRDEKQLYYRYRCSEYIEDRDVHEGDPKDKPKAYWIRKDDVGSPAKYAQKSKEMDVSEGEEDKTAGVRLAIWVEYPYASFR